MKQAIFTENTKLADVIHANFMLIYILPRFDVRLGIGEQTTKQLFENKPVSVDLFLLVCNLYTFSQYVPDEQTVAKISLEELMIYLKNSHKEYLNERVPDITQKIQEIISSSANPQTKVLDQFFDKYKKELILHFDYEEKVLFPYINALLQGQKTSHYKVKEFEKNHSNVEDKLNDLKNIIIKYLPSENAYGKAKDALVALFLLEDDLNKHNLIEDTVLVSLVEKLEKRSR